MPRLWLLVHYPTLLIISLPVVISLTIAGISLVQAPLAQSLWDLSLAAHQVPGPSKILSEPGLLTIWKGGQSLGHSPCDPFYLVLCSCVSPLASALLVPDSQPLAPSTDPSLGLGHWPLSLSPTCTSWLAPQLPRHRPF